MARVIRAAEPALADHQYVSAIDVLCGMGLLASRSVDEWRKGRIDFLEREIQGHPNKISLAMELFQEWAQENGLRPIETAYIRSSRTGTVDLRFTASGDLDWERRFRTHFISPALSEHKQQRLHEKLSRPAQPVVFQILRDSKCSECGTDLEKDSMLLMEAEQPLCLTCAGLDDLEFLPFGDTALTRRATKYSTRTAVVVRFSRSRGYERQGVLVEILALEKAEQECTDDAEERAAARVLAAARRSKEDGQLVERMTQRIKTLFPGCPEKEAANIAAHTAIRGSGRVGRSAAGQKLDESALTAAVAAAIRHRHTKYDELLGSGLDRASARERVGGEVQEILEKWRQ
jgi:hypothetical protein